MRIAIGAASWRWPPGDALPRRDRFADARRAGQNLRLLQEGTYKPLGADQFSRADVRIIAATNLDLQHLVQLKKFRSDLYFRLNVLRLVMPPLRDRRGDILLLAQHFVQLLCDEAGISRKSLAPPALEQLSRGAWPGNVRELFNVIQQAVVFAEGPTIWRVTWPSPMMGCPSRRRADSAKRARAPSKRSSDRMSRTCCASTTVT